MVGSQMSPMVLFDSKRPGPSGAERSRSDSVALGPALGITSVLSPHQTPSEVRGRGHTDDPGGPVRTQRNLVPKNVAMGRGRAAGDTRSTGHSHSGQRPADRAPHNQGGMVSGLDAHGFDEPSVEVMWHAHKGSTNATYNSYWVRFCSYCLERNLDPYESSIMTIVGFVESLRREGSWRFPTTKVCVSALSAF